MQKSPLVSILAALLLLVSPVCHVFSQGRFVRGESKSEYSVLNTKADFYVSPSGNDSWSGTLAEPNTQGTDGPFASIEKAKLAVRELKKQVYQTKKPAVDKRFIGTSHEFGSGRDILVFIRGGVYNLQTTLVFDPNDGGERIETDLPTGAFEYHELKDCFVTYAAYPGEKPIISGGISISGWEKGEQGKWFTRVNRSEVNDLYANGKRMTLARTPNTGYFLTDGQPNESAWFRFKAKDIQPWKNLENGRIRLVVRWGSEFNAISRIDVKKRLAYLEKPSPDILLVPPKYFIENVEALLDTTNEWFFDRSSGVLSFIPGKEITNPNKANVIIPQLNQLVQVQGTRERPVRNLRFFQLKFTNTRQGGDAALSAQYVKNCEWLANHIENVGQTAIQLGLGSYYNLISKNVINDGRGTGIVVAGATKPEKWNDMVSDNTISYNKVTNLRPAVKGIATYNALRSTVSHNYVSNTGSYGITLGSWPNIEETSDGSHLAEYNHVSFTNMERDDEGGIAVYGWSPGSVVRNNLIHDVHPAATNENVGFFFQNMAWGFQVSNTIFYNLKQGELKYCASYPVDNVYRDNFVVEAPTIAPEEIISGVPEFKFDQLRIEAKDQKPETGKETLISSRVFNQGSSGVAEVFLYVDGKVAVSQFFPVISNNSRTITFNYKFTEPGNHRVGVGSAPEQVVKVSGEPCYLVFQNLKTALLQIPQGDSLVVTVDAQNLRTEKAIHKIELFDNGKFMAFKELSFEKLETKKIRFAVLPSVGIHSLSVGLLAPLEIKVYPVTKVNFEKADFLTCCSTTAQPCSFDFNVSGNQYKISAAGTDFLHAEDSYGSVYLKGAVEGNFVAIVKVAGFSENISEWFRAGIFVRNDIAKSHTSEKGSLGSFLLFSTTKRCGAEWDEFGDGCMHNTKSKNYGIDHPIPVWLKLIRHGNRFSGYYSWDGKNWELSRESGEIPGLASKMDIGLAGGANDQRISSVSFEDFQLWLENSTRK